MTLSCTVYPETTRTKKVKKAAHTFIQWSKVTKRLKTHTKTRAKFNFEESAGGFFVFAGVRSEIAGRALMCVKWTGSLGAFTIHAQRTVLGARRRGSWDFQKRLDANCFSESTEKHQNIRGAEVVLLARWQILSSRDRCLNETNLPESSF